MISAERNKLRQWITCSRNHHFTASQTETVGNLQPQPSLHCVSK